MNKDGKNTCIVANYENSVKNVQEYGVVTVSS
jgi:hypothetical protein